MLTRLLGSAVPCASAVNAGSERGYFVTYQADASKPRVFAYCHDSVGIGHLVRTMSICSRLQEEFHGASFLVATGTPYVPFFETLAQTDYIKLPALEKAGPGVYRSKYFSLPTSRLMSCRAEMIRRSVEYFEPTFVLVDKAPLGVCGELLPTLTWLRAHRPDTRIVFGMRDIEDAPETTIEEWGDAGIPERLERLYDEIWVYGMRDVFDVAESYGLPGGVQQKLRYVGYVVRWPPAVAHRKCEDPRSVLVTVGGGTDGEQVLRTFLSGCASRLSSAGISSLVVSGPDLPAGVARELNAVARQIPRVQWVRFDPQLAERIASASLVVSMAGYNTLCQIGVQRKRSVVVPRYLPRKEQLIRARLWQARGVLQMVKPDTLSPEGLADQVEVALASATEPSCGVLDFGGLDRIAARFRTLTAEEEAGANSLHLR